MSKKVYINVLEYIKKTRQRLLILHNFGEPLLHPDLYEYIRIAKQYKLIPGFSTNGLLLNPDIFKKLARSGLDWICISLHTPKSLEKYYEILPLAIEAGCFLFARNFADNSFYLGDKGIATGGEKHDFAGTAPQKIDLLDTKNAPLHCDFIQKDYFVVLHDGSVVACCMDEFASTYRGNIDDIEHITHKSRYELCKKCHGARFYTDFILEERLLRFFSLFGKSINMMKLINNTYFRKIIINSLGKRIINFTI